jgi:hypothetical protein
VVRGFWLMILVSGLGDWFGVLCPVSGVLLGLGVWAGCWVVSVGVFGWFGGTFVPLSGRVSGALVFLWWGWGAARVLLNVVMW